MHCLRHSLLQRMRELAVQAGNGTNTLPDRGRIQDEMNQLHEEINRIADHKEFNTQKLFDGSSGDLKFPVGANEGQRMHLSFSEMNADSLGLTSEALNVMNAANNGDVLKAIDGALKQTYFEESKLGSYENRLGYTFSNLSNGMLNLSAASSRIKDADMAKEIVDFTRKSLLEQVSIAMVAHANLNTGGVLKLLNP